MIAKKFKNWLESTSSEDADLITFVGWGARIIDWKEPGEFLVTFPDRSSLWVNEGSWEPMGEPQMMVESKL